MTKAARIKIWYDPIYPSRPTTIYHRGHKFMGAIYCTHDAIYIHDDLVYITRVINGADSGYYQLSPTMALLAAKENKLNLFLGPEKPGIDFNNDIPIVATIPMEEYHDAI